MNEKVLYDLTYGLFLISTKANGKENGCIVNTVTQVASNPTRLAVSCIKGNLTQQLISESNLCTITILDQSVKFPLFETFGLQHGFEANKFDGYQVQYDGNAMPYIKDNACGLLSCKVLSQQDLGSHVMYIMEVVDSEKISENKPVTYAQYHSEIKPKKSQENTTRKVKGWRCTICGFVVEGEVLPADYTCLLCGHPASDFEPIYE